MTSLLLLTIFLQVNHLASVLFTLELLPVLLETAALSGDVRICFVSSKATFKASPFNIDKFLVAKVEDYGRFRSYPNSKFYIVGQIIFIVA